MSHCADHHATGLRIDEARECRALLTTSRDRDIALARIDARIAGLERLHSAQSSAARCQLHDEE